MFTDQKLTSYKNSTIFKARRGKPRQDHWKRHRLPRMKKASPLSYPWIVKIMMGRQLMCVGTVVHPHFVLTSARCVLDSSDKANSSDVLYIKSWDAEKLISFYKIVIHHQWKWYSGDYDLALIQTITPLESTICLNNIGKYIHYKKPVFRMSIISGCSLQFYWCQCPTSRVQKCS